MRIGGSLFRRSTGSGRQSTINDSSDVFGQTKYSTISRDYQQNLQDSSSLYSEYGLPSQANQNTSSIAPAADQNGFLLSKDTDSQFDDIDARFSSFDINGENHVDDYTTFMYLCDHEKGFPLMLARVKQAMVSSKDAALFIRKKALLDEEYGLQLSKLVQQFSSNEEGKDGSYKNSWQNLLQQHDQVARDRLAFAENVKHISEELNRLQQTVEKSRKQVKISGLKCQRHLSDAETVLEKLRVKYENANADWETAVQQLQQFIEIGFTNPVGAHGYPVRPVANKSFSINFNKSPPSAQRLQKIEEDCRQKVINTNEAYKAQIRVVNDIRSDFYNNKLPKLIKALKDINADVDQQLKDRLLDYTSTVEEASNIENIKITPYPRESSAIDLQSGIKSSIGMSGTIAIIDNNKDFVAYIDAPSKFSNMVQPSPKDEVNSFGKSLNELMDRDEVPVPVVLNMLFTTIESQAMVTPDIYRKSGNPEIVKKIETILNKNPEIGLSGVQFTVYDLAGCIKMFLRRLPDSVIPRHVFEDIIRAARSPDTDSRITGIHEIINSLSDAHYATLQRCLGHLHKLFLAEGSNNGSNPNAISKSLSFIFGLLLLDQGRLSSAHDSSELTAQVICIETLLNHFTDIFLSEDPEIEQSI